MNITQLTRNHLEDFPGPAIWWLGQAGFLLKSSEGKFAAIDPYLSDSLAKKYAGKIFPHIRLHPTPICPEELPPISVYLVTHGHTDHMDPETLANFTKADDYRIFCPSSQTEKAIERGADGARVKPINSGETDSFGGFQIAAIPAAHEELVVDELGFYEALGYVVRFDELTVYHSGDCTPFRGLAERLKEHSPSVALLPVNGRDRYRLTNGVPGNFFAEEALQLCLDAGIGELVPHHWGLFDFNTVPVEELQSKLVHPQVTVRIPEVGVPLELFPVPEEAAHA